VSGIWPAGFRRVPADDWVARRPEELALRYDTVREHGWYRNLDPTVESLAAVVREGDVLLDYSGGTGILAERLLARLGRLQLGVLIVDASPKFLRVALGKLADDERVAYRLIAYVKEERRLQTVQEVVDPSLLQRGVDWISSTNAIHLYYDLEDTLRSWKQVLRNGGRAFVQSGNIGVDDLAEGVWIIDATVDSIDAAAAEIVRADDRYAAYRDVLADPERRGRYAELRRKFFLPVRPLDHYLAAFEAAGFRVHDVEHRIIDAERQNWIDFLGAYHEGVLGWVGGSERIEGVPPTEEAVADRLRLLRESVERVFPEPSFRAVWTYIEAA
jgi:SAM-dependent methyltransferase